MIQSKVARGRGGGKARRSRSRWVGGGGQGRRGPQAATSKRSARSGDGVQAVSSPGMTQRPSSSGSRISGAAAKSPEILGGRRGVRTPDPLGVNEVL